MIRHSSMRARLRLLALSCVCFAGCRNAPLAPTPDLPLESEVRLLERQVTSLRGALQDSKRGELFSPHLLAVGVSESVAQSLIAQALPLQKTIAQRFEARIDKATVTFQSMQGSVNLEGRVWAQADPQTFADLILLGGIQGVEIEKSTGTLRAQIALDGFKVNRAAAMGAEASLVTEAARLLGEHGLDALRDLVPPIRIPVGVEQEIDLPGVSGGPISIPSGRLPLDAKVSRVLPLGRRLWVMIDVTTTGWSPTSLRAPRSPSVSRPAAPTKASK